MSASLNFWRTFSNLFIRNLKRTPNLEDLRVEVVIPFADEKRGRLLESAPPMTGGEYFTAETIATLWEGLQETFYRKIGAHTGSVADFLREYNPDVHLAGRIYFHLVENKDHESPCAFLDLKIKGGRVTALVQGTRAKPYEVIINIAPVKKANWEQIRKQCQGELRSLTDLIAGRFPKELGEIFLAEGKGLFPTPKEISFDCS